MDWLCGFGTSRLVQALNKTNMRQTPTMLKAFFMAWQKETQNEQKCNARPTSPHLVPLGPLVPWSPYSP